ncbi:hypothetical protein NDU88_004491 [Pleurodeles waltl]|uniref:Uncharacterized protein n=1 Tax=Pleurodeles waltl TaxID=8319 RepID=A0AAV7RH17_PLEWA|nr:hypothetical protein NDU88_004491 [Pleurodeles waltl]
MESRSTAHPTQRAGIQDRWRALSPLQGAPRRAVRSTSASSVPAPQFFTAVASGGSAAAIQLGRRLPPSRRSDTSQTPTSGARLRSLFGLTGSSGSERLGLESRASAPPRQPGPGCHFVLAGRGYGTGTGAILGHLFTSAWSLRGRESTGALETAPLAQQTAA